MKDVIESSGEWYRGIFIIDTLRRHPWFESMIKFLQCGFRLVQTWTPLVIIPIRPIFFGIESGLKKIIRTRLWLNIEVAGKDVRAIPGTRTSLDKFHHTEQYIDAVQGTYKYMWGVDVMRWMNCVDASPSDIAPYCEPWYGPMLHIPKLYIPDSAYGSDPYNMGPDSYTLALRNSIAAMAFFGTFVASTIAENLYG